MRSLSLRRPENWEGEAHPESFPWLPGRNGKHFSGSRSEPKCEPDVKGFCITTHLGEASPVPNDQFARLLEAAAI